MKKKMSYRKYASGPDDDDDAAAAAVAPCVREGRRNVFCLARLKNTHATADRLSYTSIIIIIIYCVCAYTRSSSTARRARIIFFFFFRF